MNKKFLIQKAILKTLARKKVLPLKSIINNLKNSIYSSSEYKIENKKKYAISRSINNLLYSGLIESFSSERNKYYRLTNKGKQKLNNIKIDSNSSLVSINWDGYWRIIMLDLPESRKNEREALRYLLKKAGFICVKNSVWISMYPFENLFINLKNDLGLTSEIMIIVTDTVDKETEKNFLSLSRSKNY